VLGRRAPRQRTGSRSGGGAAWWTTVRWGSRGGAGPPLGGGIEAAWVRPTAKSSRWGGIEGGPSRRGGEGRCRDGAPLARRPKVEVRGQHDGASSARRPPVDRCSSRPPRTRRRRPVAGVEEEVAPGAELSRVGALCQVAEEEERAASVGSLLAGPHRFAARGRGAWAPRRGVSRGGGVRACCTAWPLEVEVVAGAAPRRGPRRTSATEDPCRCAVEEVGRGAVVEQDRVLTAVVGRHRRAARPATRGRMQRRAARPAVFHARTSQLDIPWEPRAGTER
jgi:hypothetical protein